MMGDIADWDAARLYDLPDDFHDDDEPYEISYSRKIRETPKAWLLALDEDCKEWFPKSRCVISEKHKVVSVPQWLVLEKELQEYT